MAIERAVRALRAAREITRNITDLRNLGARVEYHAVDVCDEAALAKTIDDITARHGRISGLVHGAGIIDDGLITKKTSQGIDRVFETKVASAFLLARMLRPESLAFFCLFTSVAGRYGNRGQTDYAAANETLNRLAWVLRRQWGGRVLVKAINWGPWSGTSTGSGMVTPAVRKQFEDRGVGLVEPVAGREYFLKELLWSRPDEVEIVAGEAPWEHFEASAGSLPGTVARVPLGNKFPLLADATLGERSNGTSELAWRFDLVNAPYCDHHRFDGIPVLPFAVVLEMFTEAIRAFGFPGEVAELRDIRLLRGVTLEHGPEDLMIRARSNNGDASEIQLELMPAGDTARPCYRAVALLAPSLPVAPALPDYSGLRAVQAGPAPAVADVYANWLSHGPVFQALDKIVSLGDGQVQARASATMPGAILPWVADGTWAFDPFLLDAAIQTVWIWSRTVQNASALPLAIGSLKRFGGGAIDPSRDLETSLLNDPSDHAIDASISLRSASGRLVYAIEHLEMQSSARLNRLAGGWQGGTTDGREPEGSVR